MAPIPIPMIMYQKTPLIIKNASLKIEGKRFEKVSFSSCKSLSFSAFAKTPCTHGDKCFFHLSSTPIEVIKLAESSNS